MKKNRKKRLDWAKEKKTGKMNGKKLYGVTNHIFAYLMGMAEDWCGDNRRKSLT